MEHIKREPVILSVLAGNLLALAVAFGIRFIVFYLLLIAFIIFGGISIFGSINFN